MVSLSPPSATIEVLPDLAALVDRAYDYVLAQLQRAIAQRGQACIALAGGSTPKPLYERLAQADLPWAQIQVFWGDERFVAPDHPDSNYRMARLAWLDRVALPEPNIHPMPTEGLDPAAAAVQYAETLQTVFAPTPGDCPQFDVMLLGMGDDGHTASLFPGTAALAVTDRWVTVGEKAGEPRITLTYPVLQHSHLILFMATGANKQAALRQIFAPQADATQYPARAVQGANPENNLVWLLDSAAGEGIPENIPTRRFA
jgi:6-phosphogluconolactonase